MFSIKKYTKKIVQKFEQMFADTKAMAMTELIMGIIALFIIVLLSSAIIPTSITSVTATNTTGWGAGAISMWTTLPVIIVLVIFLIVLAVAIAVIKRYE
jgi:uncharacterized membrane protein YdbT with pleckstrin-like domain